MQYQLHIGNTACAAGLWFCLSVCLQHRNLEAPSIPIVKVKVFIIQSSDITVFLPFSRWILGMSPSGISDLLSVCKMIFEGDKVLTQDEKGKIIIKYIKMYVFLRVHFLCVEEGVGIYFILSAPPNQENVSCIMILFIDVQNWYELHSCMHNYLLGYVVQLS